MYEKVAQRETVGHLTLACRKIGFQDSGFLLSRGSNSNNQRTNGPVNAHLISEYMYIISTKPGYK